MTVGLVSYERLETILNTQAPVVIDAKNAKEIIFSKGRIEFSDVTFGYKQDKTVLQNLSFCIEDGSWKASMSRKARRSRIGLP